MTEPQNWCKSSFSGGGEGDTCVEIAVLPDRIAIRDSKDPSQGTLTVPSRSFTALIQSFKTATV
ncbi:DUF397 domain-containing protein [Streptomyces sp. E5N298]|uniref:DUF397 domain-containing protein n=1 Tax=Streptomyces sp. E5N298 TaxID=1851983 RepID=UPI000EF5726C|nr:DUF397 domain-containing protein [Streptomyces sp. E5N298]